MKERFGRSAFWVGLFAYSTSFFIPFVGGTGVYTPKLPTGADCAIDWFFFPWIYIHLHNLDKFLSDAPVGNVSVALSGWINPIFVLAVLCAVLGRTPLLTTILRTVIFIFLPFCLPIFLVQHIYPREGYVLWVTGMLLVLFSNKFSTVRFAPMDMKSVASLLTENSVQVNLSPKRLRISIIVMLLLLLNGLWFTRGGPLLPRLIGAAINLFITACFVFLLRKAKKIDSAR